MIRDEDRRTGLRDVLDPLGIDPEVPVVERSSSAYRSRERRWMEAEHVVAMTGIVERCLMSNPRDDVGVHRVTVPMLVLRHVKTQSPGRELRPHIGR